MTRLCRCIRARLATHAHRSPSLSVVPFVCAVGFTRVALRPVRCRRTTASGAPTTRRRRRPAARGRRTRFRRTCFGAPACRLGTLLHALTPRRSARLEDTRRLQAERARSRVRALAAPSSTLRPVLMPSHDQGVEAARLAGLATDGPSAGADGAEVRLPITPKSLPFSRLSLSTLRRAPLQRATATVRRASSTPSSPSSCARTARKTRRCAQQQRVLCACTSVH